MGDRIVYSLDGGASDCGEINNCFYYSRSNTTRDSCKYFISYYCSIAFSRELHGILFGKGIGLHDCSSIDTFPSTISLSPPPSLFSLPRPITYLSLPLGHPPYHPPSLLRASFLTLSSTSSTSSQASAPPVALAPPVLVPPLLLLLLLYRLSLFSSSHVSFCSSQSSCYFSFYLGHPAAAAFSSFLFNSS